MKLLSYAIIISCFLFSCSEEIEIETNAQTAQLHTQKEKSISSTVVEIPKEAIDTFSCSNCTEIKFEDFSFLIDEDQFYDHTDAIHKDYARVELDLGGSVEGVKIKIDSDKYDDIEIFQRHQNSVTITNEGPHCDLLDWKHYDSKWEQLPHKDGYWISKAYTQSDWRKFVRTDQQDLYKAVLDQCGEEWASRLEEVQSPNDEPSSVGISRIFFKVVLTEKSAGKKIEKIVSVAIPMGC